MTPAPTPRRPDPRGQPVPVVLDTDIATDVDDLLALLMVLGSPELRLVGVTATYGDTLLRARIVRQVLHWLGVEVPIGAGPRRTLSGRDIWYAGHEIDQLRPEPPARGFLPVDATDLLARLGREHRGDLHVIGVAPQTTIATALRDHPSLLDDLAGLVIMGGRFDGLPGPEHNIRCDVTAAAMLVDAGLPTTFVGLDVTRQVRLGRADFPALAGSREPLSGFVLDVLHQWTSYRDEPFVTPHDPLAVATLTHPHHFDVVAGSVVVCTDAGQRHGETSFEPGDGPARVARSLDREALVPILIDRIGRR